VRFLGAMAASGVLCFLKKTWLWYSRMAEPTWTKLLRFFFGPFVPQIEPWLTPRKRTACLHPKADDSRHVKNMNFWEAE
jgi:hypothetical protein